MPYDEKTGKSYDYTDEGIEQYKEDTGGMPYTPFKMKGFSGFGNSPGKYMHDEAEEMLSLPNWKVFPLRGKRLL